MTLSLRNIFTVIAGLVAVAIFVFAFIQQAQADITADVPTVTKDTFRNYRFFATSTVQTNFATSTVGTAAINYATSTNIAPYMDSNGRYDNGSFIIAGAKAVEFNFGRGATSTNVGGSTYIVQATTKVSPSESDWFTYTGLAPATTTSMTPTLVSSANSGAATTTIQFTMNNLNQAIYAVRCIVAITTDGTNTCSASARF